MVVVRLEAAAVQLCGLGICPPGAREVPAGSHDVSLRAAQSLHAHVV